MSVTTRNNINGGYSHSSVLLSVLVAAVTLLIISSSCFEFTNAYGEVCKGIYDRSMYATLDRICEDCYNLFYEPVVLSLCRQDCFTSDYFPGCVETLQKSDELELFKLYVKQLNGADV